MNNHTRQSQVSYEYDPWRTIRPWLRGSNRSGHRKAHSCAGFPAWARSSALEPPVPDSPLVQHPRLSRRDLGAVEARLLRQPGRPTPGRRTAGRSRNGAPHPHRRRPPRRARGVRAIRTVLAPDPVADAWLLGPPPAPQSRRRAVPSKSGRGKNADLAPGGCGPESLCGHAERVSRRVAGRPYPLPRSWALRPSTRASSATTSRGSSRIRFAVNRTTRIPCAARSESRARSPSNWSRPRW